ncbi:condensation domain-containing protein [Streptomyces tendae]|uniref:condensation domain-containing protein n=1 Tax=Streptomyces tendae TaxID=1932 RepID=UPI0033F17755
MPASTRPDILPLLPSQAWILDQLRESQLNAQRFNLCRVLTVPAECVTASALTAVTAVWRSHGALRATFHQERGAWRQHIADAFAQPPFRSVDLSRVPATEREAAIDRLTETLHNTLNVETGPLVRFLHIHAEADTSSNLVVVVHHLVCDYLSLSMLISDLDSAIARLREGREPRIVVGADYAQAVRALAAYSASDTLLGELPYWASQPWDETVMLPTDRPDYEGEAFRQWTSLTVSVDERHTHAVIRTLPEQEGLAPQQVIVGTVADALTAWADGPICVQVLRHGRDFKHGADGPVVLPPQVWRTVGFFATSGLVIVPPRGVLDPVAYLQSIAELMRAAPNHGTGIGLLRWSAPAGPFSTAVRKMWSRSAVQLNYFGSGSRRARNAFQAISVCDRPISSAPDPLESRLPLTVRMAVRADRLRVTLDYDAGLHLGSTAAEIAQLICDGFSRYASATAT